MGLSNFKARTRYRATCQRVLENAHIHTLGARITAQLGEIRYCCTPIFGEDHRLGFCDLGRNFRNDFFLTF